MPATFLISQYQGWTRTKLNRTSYDGTKLLQFADEANKEICNDRIWRFLEKTFSGTIQAGITDYQLPADYQAAINFLVTDPDNKAIPMEYRPFELWDQDFPDPTALTASAPTLWTVFGDSLIVGPAAPDQEYTLRLRYIKTPKNITQVTDTPDVTDDFSELLTLGMYRRALLASDNFNQAQVIYQEWQDKMDNMQERLQSRQIGAPVRMGNGRRRSGT